MARVPNTTEIEAYAAELGEDLTFPGARARVGTALRKLWADAERLAAQEKEDAARSGGTAELLSRSVSKIDGGKIVVETYWVADRRPSSEQGEPR